LVRPGRFDRHVPVPLPDLRGRTAILSVHAKPIVMSPEVDLHTLARGTPGLSGADLANLLNIAALHASRRGGVAVESQDLQWARDRVLMGAERKSAVITPEGKQKTAIHEAGHAIVAMFTAGCHPLHKVTVMPRGDALGLTMTLPLADVTSQTRKELLASLDMAMGGRVAEELWFGSENVSTGAASDLTNATRVAREMVVRYGFGGEEARRQGGGIESNFGSGGSNNKDYRSSSIGLASWGREMKDGGRELSEGYKGEVEREVKALLDVRFL